MLQNSVRFDWPPYNIEKRGEDQYRITMAVAGFAPSDVELVQHGSTLLVTQTHRLLDGSATGGHGGNFAAHKRTEPENAVREHISPSKNLGSG